MNFILDKSQIEKLELWKEEINKQFSQYGLFTFEFTPTAIGTTVIVKSLLAGTTLDLSECEKW